MGILWSRNKPDWLPGTLHAFSAASTTLRDNPSAYHGAYYSLLQYDLFKENGFLIRPLTDEIPFTYVVYDISELVRCNTYLGERNMRRTYAKEFDKTLRKSPPVFILQIRNPCYLDDELERREADEALGKKIAIVVKEAAETIWVPELHCVTTFGTRLAFYCYNTSSETIIPHDCYYDRELLGGLAAAGIERWDTDVLSPEGAGRLRRIVNDIKMQMPLEGNAGG